MKHEFTDVSANNSMDLTPLLGADSRSVHQETDLQYKARRFVTGFKKGRYWNVS
jgi:hypothetical protein